MKTISKEKAWIGIDLYKTYCFEERNDNYLYSFYNDYKFISDITVDENNKIHSYNDQPALIYIDKFNRLCKLWFINGQSKRLNPEKPRLIIKGCGYTLNNGKSIGFEKIKYNLK